MKKYYVFLFMAFASFTTEAQLAKGTLQLGGIINGQLKNGDAEFETLFGNGTENTYESRELTLMSQVGFFVKNNLSVGVSFGYTSESSSISSRNPPLGSKVETKSSAQVYSLEVFARLHHSAGKQIYLFLEPALNLGRGKAVGQQPRQDEVKWDIIRFETGLRPGLVWMINPKIGLESSIGFIGYRFERHELTSETNNTLNTTPVNTSRDLIFDISMSSINFGLQFYL